MSSVVIQSSELSGELAHEVSTWLKSRNPDLIAVPYKGRHARGFIFRWKSVTYIIIQSIVTGAN